MIENLRFSEISTSYHLPLAEGAMVGFATSDQQQVWPIYRLAQGGFSFSASNWLQYEHKRKRNRNPVPHGSNNMALWREKRDVDEYFRAAKELNAQVIRFAIDPTRLVDSKRKVIPQGVAFLQEVIEAAKTQGVKLNIAFYHKAMPPAMLWTEQNTLDYFAKVVDVFLENFGRSNSDTIAAYTPIVEATNEILAGYVSGALSPYRNAVLHGRDISKAYHNMAVFHRLAIKRIKKFYEEKKITLPKLFISHNWIPIRAQEDMFGGINRRLAEIFYNIWNRNIREFLLDEDGKVMDDVIFGINVYDRITDLSVERVSSFPFLHDQHYDPQTLITALKEARAFADGIDPRIKISVEEMGMGVRPEMDGEAQRNLMIDWLRSLKDLSFQLHGLSLWTLAPNKEWLDGDRQSFGVTRKEGEKLCPTKLGEAIAHIFATRSVLAEV